MFRVLFVLLTFFSSPIFSQKRIEKRYTTQAFNKIRLVSDEITSLNVIEKETNEVYIEAYFNGETADNVILTSENKEGVLLLGTSFTPFFIPLNDKLAAHKVLAIDLTIIVPLGILPPFIETTFS